jgi:primase-polymerase (primpol)-like protein
MERLVNPVVPDDLGELDRWAVWRMEGGAKVPYRVRGGRASSTNPHHWGDLEAARRAFSGGDVSGLAFAFFREDGLVGIDLDDSLDANGNAKPEFRGIVERFADTYTEVSPSGRGLKMWVRGRLPANLPKVAVEGGGVEMYDHARYFTFTGNRFRGAPLEIASHGEDVSYLYDRLTKGTKKTWSLQPLQGGRIPYGQQHSTLVSIAGTLRARRVCEEAIEACLQMINAKQCEKPGPAANISRIIRSSRRWAGGAA